MIGIAGGARSICQPTMVGRGRTCRSPLAVGTALAPIAPGSTADNDLQSQTGRRRARRIWQSRPAVLGDDIKRLSSASARQVPRTVAKPPVHTVTSGMANSIGIWMRRSWRSLRACQVPPPCVTTSPR